MTKTDKFNADLGKIPMFMRSPNKKDLAILFLVLVRFV